jgi:hypothetical protein
LLRGGGWPQEVGKECPLPFLPLVSLAAAKLLEDRSFLAITAYPMPPATPVVVDGGMLTSITTLTPRAPIYLPATSVTL